MSLCVEGGGNLVMDKVGNICVYVCVCECVFVYVCV